MADNEEKSTMKEFAINEQAYYYSGTTCITVNGKMAYELKGIFVDDLRNNAFNGTNGEDAEKNNDQGGVIDGGFFGLEEAHNDDEQEIGEIFRIETNLFDYETPLCTMFNKFNYLLKVDPKLFTYDIERTMDYEDYENRLNDEPEEPWSENGVPYEIGDHICVPFHFKNGKTKWPTCSSNEDGFCNDGELPGMVRVGYMTYFQDHECYNDLMDGSLKDKALEQKAIYKESRGDAKQIEREDEERHELCFDATQVMPVCNIRRFVMIKYSFGDDEKYVAIKEDEYDDLTSTSEDACRTYQEIFGEMDEGWMVTRDE
ncbi:hypothetical protein Tco_0311882 [Tanacetum coccineum]